MKTKGNLQVIAKHDRNASRTWKMLLRSDGTSSYSHGLWATEAQDHSPGCLAAEEQLLYSEAG